MSDSEARSLVLVIDDNRGNRALARACLEEEGYEVVEAAGGIDGISVFQGRLPECVLLDVRMPDLDGFSVCERLRASPGGRDVPVLFLTGLRDIDTFDRALRAGGDDFLTKPIVPTELVLRVRSALRLRRANADLREHYDLLKQQRDALLRLQLQKQRLTTFVVHDLKNPVSSMDLHAQVLQRMAGLPAEAVESVQAIRTEGRKLSRMILDLLDLSKAEEGRLAPRRSSVDLPTLVAEVLAELELSARSRGVSLCSAIGVERVHTDLELLRRTLTNLVENAIRYAPPRSSVSIAATSLSSSTEVRVTDAGQGIAKEMRERIFDPFVQAEANGDSKAAYGGRGLGLAFCKHAVEAHGGRIWVEDAAPGAVFCATFPNAC